MACPHGGLKNGGGVMGGYYKWINNGLNPAEKANDWYLDGKSTLIIQNNQLNDDQTTIRTSNIPQIVSLLSGLEIVTTNFNSLRLGSENPVIIKGNAKLWSTCGKFDGFKKITYTITYCFIPNPDGLTERLFIQTHIIRFFTPVVIPTLTPYSRIIDEDDIAKAVVSGDDFDMNGSGLNGLGLSMVQEYYECLVKGADVASREFYWGKSMMLKGGPKPEGTLICADDAPEIQHLLSFMNITQVTVTGLCCVHEPNTNTLLVDVSGIAKYHDDFRPFSELLCVSSPLIPSPIELKHKQYYGCAPTTSASDSHDIGGRRYRFACSIIDFIDPPLFMQLWIPFNKIPATKEQIEQEEPTTPKEHSKVELTKEEKQRNRKSSFQSLRRCFQRLN